MKINLVTKITILALWIFLVTALLIQLLIHTQFRGIIEEEQEKAYTRQLDIILTEIKRTDEELGFSITRAARLGDARKRLLDDLQRNYLRSGDPDTYIFILDGAGTVLLHPNLPRGNRSLAEQFLQENIEANRGRFIYEDATGTRRWASFVRYPDWQWILCYSVPLELKNEAFASFHNSLSVILAGSFLLMGLFLAYFLSMMLKPVSRLTRAANAIAEGSTDQKIDIRGSDEIGTMARAFEHMRRALNAKIRELRTSEFKYRNLVQSANSVILRWDRQGRVIFLNDFGQRLFGFRREEIVGKSVVGTIIAEKGATGRELTDMIDSIVANPERYIVNEKENICRDGRRVWVQWSNNAIMDSQGNFLEMLSVGIDITEQKITAKRLQETEQRFRALFESANDAILILDENGICIDCNRKALELFGCGRDELIGQSPRDMTPPRQPDGADSLRQSRQSLGRALSGTPQTMDWQIRRADGTLRDVIATMNSFTANARAYVQVVFTDVTRQKRMESKLRQAQKMEGIGTLAGGIAHDFNNILSAIIGYTELAMMKSAAIPELTEDLQQVRMASERAKDLIRQILSFSRKEKQEKTVLQISLIVKEALKLIRSSIPTTIEIVQDISTNAAVLTDPTEIHQLIMNLCTNAYQAMTDTGGTLSVSMREVTVRGEKGKALELSDGNYVHIEVRDTGTGMDEATLDRIFDPFFTTKEQGRGTGLGLAVVYDIVEGNDGGIDVRSEPGKGTTFDIYLPVASEQTAEDAGAVKRPPPVHDSRPIMIVDDEVALRNLLRALLGHAGYRVEEFADGREAWEAFRQSPKKWSLIITDQTMPLMTGKELALRVMELRPDLPIILCTGFSESVSVEQARKLGIRAFLYKPLSLNELLSAVHDCLGTDTGPGT